MQWYKFWNHTTSTSRWNIGTRDQQEAHWSESGALNVAEIRETVPKKKKKEKGTVSQMLYCELHVLIVPSLHLHSCIQITHTYIHLYTCTQREKERERAITRIHMSLVHETYVSCCLD